MGGFPPHGVVQRAQDRGQRWSDCTARPEAVAPDTCAPLKLVSSLWHRDDRSFLDGGCRAAEITSNPPRALRVCPVGALLGLPGRGLHISVGRVMVRYARDQAIFGGT